MNCKFQGPKDETCFSIVRAQRWRVVLRPFPQSTITASESPRHSSPQTHCHWWGIPTRGKALQHPGPETCQRPGHGNSSTLSRQIRDHEIIHISVTIKNNFVLPNVSTKKKNITLCQRKKIRGQRFGLLVCFVVVSFCFPWCFPG